MICQHVPFPIESSREAGLQLEATNMALGRQMNDLVAESRPASSPCLCALTWSGRVPPSSSLISVPLTLSYGCMHTPYTDIHTTPSLVIVKTWKNIR